MTARTLVLAARIIGINIVMISTKSLCLAFLLPMSWAGCADLPEAPERPVQVPESFVVFASTSFEGMTKIDEHRLDWDFPHWFEYAAMHREDGGEGDGEGGARMWVDTEKSRTGVASIGMELSDIRRSRRAEFAIFLDGLPSDEYFLSYWLYLDDEWGLFHPRGEDWYEIGNPYSFGGRPYSAIWIYSPDAEQKVFAVELGGRHADGSKYHAGRKKGFELPRNRWFQIVSYVKLDETSGAVRLWIDGDLVGSVSGIPTRDRKDARLGASVAKIYHDREDKVPKRIWIDDLEIYAKPANP